MKEIVGDLWSQTDANAICITVNGSLDKANNNIMSEGCAAEAKMIWKDNDLPRRLGEAIQSSGNRVYFTEVGVNLPRLVFFPVKRAVNQDIDLHLVRTSCLQLKELATKQNWKRIVLPRSGFESENLKWEVVKQVLASILDKRFYIIREKKKK